MLVDLIGILIPRASTGVLLSSMPALRALWAFIMATRAASIRASPAVFVRFGSCAIELCTLFFVFCNEIFYGRRTENI